MRNVWKYRKIVRTLSRACTLYLERKEIRRNSHHLDSILFWNRIFSKELPRTEIIYLASIVFLCNELISTHPFNDLSGPLLKTSPSSLMTEKNEMVRGDLWGGPCNGWSWSGHLVSGSSLCEPLLLFNMTPSPSSRPSAHKQLVSHLKLLMPTLWQKFRISFEDHDRHSSESPTLSDLKQWFDCVL